MFPANRPILTKLIEYLTDKYADKYDLNDHFIEYTPEVETLIKKKDISTIDLDNLLISEDPIVLPNLPSMSTKHQQFVEREQLKAQKQLETERLNAEKELMAQELKEKKELRAQELNARQLKARHKIPVNRLLLQTFKPSLETRPKLQLLSRTPAILPDMSAKQTQLNALRDTSHFPRTLPRKTYRPLHRVQRSNGGYTIKTIKNTRKPIKNTRKPIKNTRKTIKNTSRHRTYKSTELKSQLV
jgi:hypothetical protein